MTGREAVRGGAPFIVTCRRMQAGDCGALVEVQPFLLC